MLSLTVSNVGNQLTIPAAMLDTSNAAAADAVVTTAVAVAVLSQYFPSGKSASSLLDRKHSVSAVKWSC